MGTPAVGSIDVDALIVGLQLAGIDKTTVSSFPLVLIFVVAVTAIALIVAAIMPRLPPNARDLVRHGGFIVLHVSNYATNIIIMVICWMAGSPSRNPASGLRWYLAVLLPVHLLIGLFCVYTAFNKLDWQQWACLPMVNMVFSFLFLGLMQGIQVKLACDDFSQQRARRAGELADAPQAAPNMMPARFHCKSMDGILEATVFSFVAMHVLLRNNWELETPLRQWEKTMLFIGAVLGFLTTGLALMEVDHRTSMSVQKFLNSSAFAQVRHLGFRSSEFSLRLFTILAFVTFTRAVVGRIWIIFMVVVCDYIVGVLLLVFLGGRDPARNAAVVLGVPLLVVNVMQFVDAPGMSLQARRISSIIVPWRSVELVVVVVLCTFFSRPINVKGKEETLRTYISDHQEWFYSWIFSAGLYFLLFFIYASRVKPGADLHSAVAYGDVECLENLLCSSELVLDINRYGPDGRTPLHLAALRGQVECMRLLMEQRANIHARTSNQQRNTALHLAAMCKTPLAMRYLCKECDDAEFLNAVNNEGDTALHIAAQRKNVGALQELLRQPKVNLKLKNNKAKTAADCAPSEKFGFDRNSAESAIAELLRHAENGVLPGTSGEALEMSTVGSQTRTATLNVAAPSAAVEAERSVRDLESAGASSGSHALAMLPEDSHVAGGVSVKDNSQHNVPLLAVPSIAEKEFLRRAGRSVGPAQSVGSVVNVTNCGISSFMLSAGLGALSHAFLGTIREELEEPVGEQQSVKATFEDFVEKRFLGEGAFGKVIMVEHKESKEVFAMKIMDKAKFKAAKITSKAHSEQYILKTTRHPFIVSLHYAFQGTSFWALVMDYCPNGDLQKLLSDYGTPGLAFKEVARYCGEVMLAIEHLHSIRVIFRDLKLENVVIDPEWRARVTDFGLAKKLMTEADAKTMCGSYGYAAPEIMLNTGRYTYAVDLYSFGVMVYMMVSGGEEAPKNPKQRLPPMRHSSLRRRIREAERTPGLAWAQPQVGAMELLNILTAEDPQVRTTASLIKEHQFFRTHLGQPVDALLTDAGPWYPPGGGPAAGSAGNGSS